MLVDQHPQSCCGGKCCSWKTKEIFYFRGCPFTILICLLSFVWFSSFSLRKSKSKRSTNLKKKVFKFFFFFPKSKIKNQQKKKREKIKLILISSCCSFFVWGIRLGWSHSFICIFIFLFLYLFVYYLRLLFITYLSFIIVFVVAESKSGRWWGCEKWMSNRRRRKRRRSCCKSSWSWSCWTRIWCTEGRHSTDR